MWNTQWASKWLQISFLLWHQIPALNDQKRWTSGGFRTGWWGSPLGGRIRSSFRKFPRIKKGLGLFLWISCWRFRHLESAVFVVVIEGFYWTKAKPTIPNHKHETDAFVSVNAGGFLATLVSWINSLCFHEAKQFWGAKLEQWGRQVKTV